MRSTNKEINVNGKFTLSEKVWVLIFFLCVYSLSTSGGTFHSIDGQVLYSVGRNMVTKLSATIDDHHFAQYAPLQSIIEGIGYRLGVFLQKVIPPFRTYGEKFLIFSALYVNVLITAFTCVLILVFAQALFLNKKISLILTLIYGLSTTAWVYAKWDQAEPLSTLFILYTSYSLYKFKLTKNGKYLYLAGCSFGMAIATKYYPIILFPAICIYLILVSTSGYHKVSWKDWGKFLLPLIPIIILLLVYNWLRFGNPIKTNYVFRAGRIDFRPEYIYAGFYGLLFSAGKGFFFYNPITSFSLIGVRRFYEKYKDECVFFLIVIFTFLIFFASFLNWAGGYCWGPRHLLAIVPFLILITGMAIQELWKKYIFRLFFYFLLAYGVFVQFLGILVHLQHFYGSVMQDQSWQWTYFPFFSPIIGNFWVIVSLITNISIPYPAPQPFDLYLGSVSGTRFDLFFLNSIFEKGGFLIKSIAGLLLVLAIVALYKLWRKLNFTIHLCSWKKIFISIFSIISIFFLFSPLKNLNIFFNPLKSTEVPIPNYDFLIDSGKNFGFGDSEANNGIPDGWESGDWSPKKLAVSLSLSSEHRREGKKSLEIKTLNSPALFRLRTSLITISPYKRLSLRSYMKKEVGLNPFFWVAFFDKDFRPLTEMQGIRFFGKNEDWKLAKFECIVPEKAFYAQISLALWSYDVLINKRIWVDAIKLYGIE
jgi:hypothetical protein